MTSSTQTPPAAAPQHLSDTYPSAASLPTHTRFVADEKYNSGDAWRGGMDEKQQRKTEAQQVDNKDLSRLFSWYQVDDVAVEKMKQKVGQWYELVYDRVAAGANMLRQQSWRQVMTTQMKRLKTHNIVGMYLAVSVVLPVVLYICVRFLSSLLSLLLSSVLMLVEYWFILLSFTVPIGVVSGVQWMKGPGTDMLCQYLIQRMDKIKAANLPNNLSPPSLTASTAVQTPTGRISESSISPKEHDKVHSPSKKQLLQYHENKLRKQTFLSPPAQPTSHHHSDKAHPVHQFPISSTDDETDPSLKAHADIRRRRLSTPLISPTLLKRHVNLHVGADDSFPTLSVHSPGSAPRSAPGSAPTRTRSLTPPLTQRSTTPHFTRAARANSLPSHNIHMPIIHPMGSGHSSELLKDTIALPLSPTGMDTPIPPPQTEIVLNDPISLALADANAEKMVEKSLEQAVGAKLGLNVPPQPESAPLSPAAARKLPLPVLVSDGGTSTPKPNHASQTSPFLSPRLHHAPSPASPLFSPLLHSRSQVSTPLASPALPPLHPLTPNPNNSRAMSPIAPICAAVPLLLPRSAMPNATANANGNGNGNGGVPGRVSDSPGGPISPIARQPITHGTSMFSPTPLSSASPPMHQSQHLPHVHSSMHTHPSITAMPNSPALSQLSRQLDHLSKLAKDTRQEQRGVGKDSSASTDEKYDKYESSDSDLMKNHLWRTVDAYPSTPPRTPPLHPQAPRRQSSDSTTIHTNRSHALSSH